MTINRLITSLEILFWDITILLLSRSRIFQRLVMGCYQVFYHLRNGFQPARLMLWALSGWGLGFALGFIGTFILR